MLLIYTKYIVPRALGLRNISRQYPMRKLLLEGYLVLCFTEDYLIFVCDISPTESKIFMVILKTSSAMSPIIIPQTLNFLFRIEV